MSERNKMLAVRQVAELLDIPTRSIHRWVVKGYFPGAYKAGPEPNSPYRIPQSAVDAFVEEQEKRRILPPAKES